MSQSIEKRLYDIKEASAYLGRTVWGLRKALWRGEMPFIRSGRRIWLDKRDMDQWIERNKTKEEM